MQAIKKQSEVAQLMRQWRHEFHAHPETAFEEYRTAARVAELLKSFGLKVETGLAGTGVVATLEGKHRPQVRHQPDPTARSHNTIALRADMDALNLDELNQFAHRSTIDGKMHGCGHDGHTSMLLGAACYLARNPDFCGTAVFIFQPAEEGQAGARVMCEQGLFERYPVDAVYGMHNWPGLPAGEFAVHDNAVMAAMDTFDITISARGCHAGMPHLGVDPVVVAAQLITALQSLVSRNLDPTDSAVVSVTRMHGGDAYNVVPETVTLSGTCRSFCPQIQQQLQARMAVLVEHICAGFGATGELNYHYGYPATINTPAQAAICAEIASSLVGAARVHRDKRPSMGAEDFAFMLQQRPGAYIWLGNGPADQGRGLHNPYYDFNDEILALGASYWVELVRSQLSNGVL